MRLSEAAEPSSDSFTSVMCAQCEQGANLVFSASGHTHRVFVSGSLDRKRHGCGPLEDFLMLVVLLRGSGCFTTSPTFPVCLSPPQRLSYTSWLK